MMFFLICAACFLGLLAGMALAFIAPEELVPGKNHLWIFQSVLLIMLAVMFVGLNLFGFWWMILAGSLVVVAIFLAHKYKVERLFHQIIFILSPVLLFFSYAQREALIIVSSLVFLYGMPVSSLFVLEHEKLIKRHKSRILLSVLKNYGIFLVLALILAFFA